ncbi:MAG: ribonucleotide-diphosphate reductase subunit beta [Pseudomonadota bacterium]|nr:ribonucleotide-diphosphate reductase subunit beta [Pseudomonadota bacterium]
MRPLRRKNGNYTHARCQPAARLACGKHRFNGILSSLGRILCAGHDEACSSAGQERKAGLAGAIKAGIVVDDAAQLLELTPSARRRTFPAWHFAMLNDTERNAALENMVAGLDLAGKMVLEIGTGCGLMALLFAKYGAEHVHTCEINRDLADVASGSIAETPFRNKITLHRKSSTALVRSGSLPRSPDIIFTETLDCGVVGEGFFAISRDICRVAGPQTQVVPSVVRQFGMLVEASSLRNLNQVEAACGFDLSALNVHSTETYFPIHEEMHDYSPLSQAFRLRDYSYVSSKPPSPVEVPVHHSGAADGVISWFEAQFGSEIVSNCPGSRGHWHQAFHPFATRIPVAAQASLWLIVDDQGRMAVPAP